MVYMIDDYKELETFLKSYKKYFNKTIHLEWFVLKDNDNICAYKTNKKIDINPNIDRERWLFLRNCIDLELLDVRMEGNFNGIRALNVIYQLLNWGYYCIVVDFISNEHNKEIIKRAMKKKINYVYYGDVITYGLDEKYNDEKKTDTEYFLANNIYPLLSKYNEDMNIKIIYDFFINTKDN